MRITGGKHRGRAIQGKDDRQLRPTSARNREVIFNILKHGRFRGDPRFSGDGADLVENRRAVDIFCGSGALGLEALSRGAAHVTFVDQNAQTLAVAQANVRHLGEEARASFVRSDSTMLPPAPLPCMLAFVDPPYLKNLGIPAMKSLAAQGWLAADAVVILEQGKQDDPREVPGFLMLDDRVHDKTRITVYQFTGSLDH